MRMNNIFGHQINNQHQTSEDEGFSHRLKINAKPEFIIVSVNLPGDLSQG
jgi:hypothetical protein